MATNQDDDPLGSIKLVEYFHESSSSHYDESRTVVLSPGKAKWLVMVEKADSCDQFKGGRESSESHWTIERDMLIALIKEHGQRVK